ncbi:unnamed protein product [Ixodes persulcatus]
MGCDNTVKVFLYHHFLLSLQQFWFPNCYEMKALNSRNLKLTSAIFVSQLMPPGCLATAATVAYPGAETMEERARSQEQSSSEFHETTSCW